MYEIKSPRSDDAGLEYPAPLLTALNDGVHLDMRVKFAMELLKAPGFAQHILATHGTVSPGEIALELADDLFRQARARGWLAPLPLTETLPAEEIAHVKRNAHAQVEQQVHLQRTMQEVAQRVQPVVGAGLMSRQ